MLCMLATCVCAEDKLANALVAEIFGGIVFLLIICICCAMIYQCVKENSNVSSESSYA